MYFRQVHKRPAVQELYSRKLVTAVLKHSGMCEAYAFLLLERSVVQRSPVKASGAPNARYGMCVLCGTDAFSMLLDARSSTPLPKRSC